MNTRILNLWTWKIQRIEFYIFLFVLNWAKGRSSSFYPGLVNPTDHFANLFIQWENKVHITAVFALINECICKFPKERGWGMGR